MVLFGDEMMDGWMGLSSMPLWEFVWEAGFLEVTSFPNVNEDEDDVCVFAF